MPTEYEMKIARLAHWVHNGKKVVVLTGAGMSTESGVPDFRGVNGMWKDHRIHDLASPKGIEENFEAFTDFYRWRLDGLLRIRPNAGHLLLAEWERRGLISAIVTQNVDGLHRQAGSVNVIELHGNVQQIRCQRCTVDVPVERYMEDATCPLCSGKLRPRVVLFGEPLDKTALRMTADLTAEAEMLLVLGSSLQVAPANKLPIIARDTGARFAIINGEPTPWDDQANLVANYWIVPTLRDIEAKMHMFA